MGQLLWTYGNGVDFQTDRDGFRLIAGRASNGTGYQYAVLARDDASGATPLASGSRETLREAFEAAEQAVGAIDSALPLAM